MSRSRIDRATPSLIEPPVLRHALVATIAPLAPIDKTYSFLVPDELAERLKPGMRVEVPFGRSGRPRVAFCVDVSKQEWASTLKTIISVVDETPMIGPKLLELGRWLSRYYCSYLGHTLDMMIPAAAKARAGRRRVKYVRLAEDIAKTLGEDKLASAKQQAVVQALRREGQVEIGRLCDLAGCTPAVVTGLEKKGLVTVEIVMEEVSPVEANPSPHHPDFELSDDQQSAIGKIGEAVTSGKFSVQVLFGVTGSGKTEVYVSAIRQVLAAGRQAIMLVPEIALTTQTVRRLQTRFERVAVLHSGLSGVQRSRAWSAIARGEIPVVIGTRSAVFAPCPSLGVIIVDEEAEPSYKNLAAPRYHTRDVAIQRANLEGIPVVLGSATPSLETWKNAHQRKHYQLLRMPTRVRGLAMPQVYLVDMRQEHHERSGVHMLSRAMEDHLNATLARKEQAVLLLNRRGYAGYLHCPKCKYVYTCPHCDVHMVFHASTGLAHCHYCHQRVEMPKFCPMSNCDGRLSRFGIGTQRVEEELGLKFPAARVRRMDSDAMQKNEDYADILAAFERREFDFLVGTQMIAKGLDFPFVSFVGIVSADTALGLNDFRSEERTFQLVLQVAGRSGRGDAPGHVVVQTFAADADPIRHAVAGNYEAFADGELQKRRRAKLPPWTRMMRIIIADPLYTKLQKAGDALKQELDAALERRGIAASVFGPSPCPIKRLRDSYRMDIQLTFDTAGAMLSAIDLFKSEGTLKSSVKTLTVDVDPVSLQ
ncbi:MAG: primosomal protein N' [Planctomycetia bacterium]|nr:primosomal protein N' [Planctomycetia bacterium]MCC7314668.1 primosomal protein N' [Planctomycetota bacterium]OQZ06299.1 MAG: primosomal protein N' [Planctomycetes bacterium UTPLA1]